MKIAANNAELWLFPNFIKAGQSRILFQHLFDTIAWQQDTLMMYGKSVEIPRLQAWFGGNSARYAYSGLTLQPTAWLPALEKIKNALNEQCQNILVQDESLNEYLRDENLSNKNFESKVQQQQIQAVNFNSVLANCYRDNNDAVAWHSDDEPELGQQPIIASVSLGATRDFKLKHKTTGEKLTIPLTSGSLLLMAGQTQHYWQHAILRSKKAIAPRINLTFREIKQNL
ncbi:MAG: alpha-ketoglutarate-dependent dioxygenase AlkB family protein [Thalassotalea sp.]